MRIIPPINITETNLVSSNIVEDDQPPWLIGTTYSAGDKVVHVHKIYESIAGANAGNQPDITPLKWLLLGATNRFRAFDKLLSDQAERSDNISYVIDNGGVGIDSVALFNLDAASVRVQVIDDIDGTVYDATFALIDNTDITNWSDYFFWTRWGYCKRISSHRCSALWNSRNDGDNYKNGFNCKSRSSRFGPC